MSTKKDPLDGKRKQKLQLDKLNVLIEFLQKMKIEKPSKFEKSRVSLIESLKDLDHTFQDQINYFFEKLELPDSFFEVVPNDVEDDEKDSWIAGKVERLFLKIEEYFFSISKTEDGYIFKQLSVDQYQLGLANELCLEFRKALDCYKRAIEFDPTNKEAQAKYDELSKIFSKVD